jgi:hypothetical protein
LSKLDLNAVEKAVRERAVELIEMTRKGRKDRQARKANLFTPRELREVSDAVAAQALDSAKLSITDIAHQFPEVFQQSVASAKATDTLEAVARNNLQRIVSDLAYRGAATEMQSHIGHVSLADIVSVFRQGFGRVANRKWAGDVYGYVEMRADLFINQPSAENFKALLHEASNLDTGLDGLHEAQLALNPSRQSLFQGISRQVSEMLSIGKEIASNPERLELAIQQFRQDLEDDEDLVLPGRRVG